MEEAVTLIEAADALRDNQAEGITQILAGLGDDVSIDTEITVQAGALAWTILAAQEQALRRAAELGLK